MMSTEVPWIPSPSIPPRRKEASQYTAPGIILYTHSGTGMGMYSNSGTGMGMWKECIQVVELEWKCIIKNWNGRGE